MSTRTFWTRVVLASVVLNLPVAVAIVVAGFPLVAGMAVSGILGTAALAVLDRQRTALSPASPAMELRVVGRATASDASATAPVGQPS